MEFFVKELEDNKNKKNNNIVSSSDLIVLRQNWQDRGYTVVFTNGCFDLLHLGHVQYLQEAKALGDVLVVGLNSDASVTRLKGPLRPLVPAMERAQVMAALRSVDFLTIFEEDTAENLIAALRPDIYVKGGDYEVNSGASVPTSKVLPEAATVQSYGGRIQLIPFLPGHSTTGLIKKIVAAYS